MPVVYGKDTPKLGFGLMRLPKVDEKTSKWLDFWVLRVLWDNMQAPSELNMLKWQPQ